MPFQIIRDDITRVRADAIVNTANPDPIYASGTDHAIYMAAGPEELLSARREIGEIAVGEAKATPAFRLHARYIIHTVGPAWEGGDHGEMEALASCYSNSLDLADRLNVKSIAFPLISAGVYGFPKDQALSAALGAIAAFLEDHEMDITLVVFNRTAFELSAGLAGSVRQFIDDRYVEARHAEEYGMGYLQGYSAGKAEHRLDEHRKRQKLTNTRPDQAYASESEAGVEELSEDLEEKRDMNLCSAPVWASSGSAPKPAAPKASASSPKLSDIIKHIGESFQQMLFRKIDEKGMSDAEVYKKANIDRRLFSKIRSNPYYCPRKQTAVALAIALGLNLDETIDLLKSAGYALSPSSIFDLIIEYCIENRIYDIFEVNAILFDYDQPLLGV